MKQFATEYVSFKFGCLLCFKIQFKLKEKAWRRRIWFAHVHLYTDFFFFNIKYYSTMDKEAWHAAIHGVAKSQLFGTERLNWLTDWLTYNSDLVESLNVKFKDQHRYRGPTLKLYSDFLLCKGSVPLTEMLFKDHQYYISFSAEVLTSWATDLCCGVLGFGPHSRRWAAG